MSTERPSVYRLDSLWSFEEAVSAYERAAVFSASVLGLVDRRDVAQAVEAVQAVLVAHMPVRHPAGHGDYTRGEPAELPERAVCKGDCRDGGTPAPWPCPGARPLLDALEVSRGR